MKNEKSPSALIITGIIFVAIVVAGSVLLFRNHSRIEQLSTQNSDLNSTIRVRDSLVNAMASTFDEIEKNLSFVREKRSQLSLETGEHAKGKREVLVADIKLMNEMLEQNSQKIEELDKKLKASGVEIQSFKNKIAMLNKDIAEQNNSIRQLTAEVEKRDYKIAEMNVQVRKLTDDNYAKDDTIMMKAQVIADKNKVIEAKDNELNKVYYACGTAKELMEKGVIEKEGGFLGLGRNTEIKNDIDSTKFSTLDERTDLMLPVFAKKVEFVTEHPDSSYQLVYQDNKVAYVHIEDPGEFWKLSKYLVLVKR